MGLGTGVTSSYTLMFNAGIFFNKTFKLQSSDIVMQAALRTTVLKRALPPSCHALTEAQLVLLSAEQATTATSNEKKSHKTQQEQNVRKPNT